jgi:hypothetical protein
MKRFTQFVTELNDNQIDPNFKNDPEKSARIARAKAKDATNRIASPTDGIPNLTPAPKSTPVKGYVKSKPKNHLSVVK